MDEYTIENDIGPTYRIIADHFGTSIMGSYKHCEAFRHKIRGKVLGDKYKKTVIIDNMIMVKFGFWISKENYQIVMDLINKIHALSSKEIKP